MGRINQKGIMRVVKDEKINTDCNDKLETFRLNFSRCTNRDVAPLKFAIWGRLGQDILW